MNGFVTFTILHKKYLNWTAKLRCGVYIYKRLAWGASQMGYFFSQIQGRLGFYWMFLVPFPLDHLPRGPLPRQLSKNKIATMRVVDVPFVYFIFYDKFEWSVVKLDSL